MPEESEIANNAIVKITNFLPSDMDKKKLFNAIQEATPLEEICDKKFKVIGIKTDDVYVARENEEDVIKAGRTFDPTDTVLRTRLTLITNIGVFNSFSITFHKALENAFAIFGDDYKNEEYIITKKSKGKKQYYSVKVV